MSCVATDVGEAPASRRALAHELLGATDAMPAPTGTPMRDSVSHRRSVVKHRLADVYVAPGGGRGDRGELVVRPRVHDAGGEGVGATAARRRSDTASGARRHRFHLAPARSTSAGSARSTASTAPTDSCAPRSAGCSRRGRVPGPARPEFPPAPTNSAVPSSLGRLRGDDDDYRLFDADEHYEPEDALPAPRPQVPQRGRWPTSTVAAVDHRRQAAPVHPDLTYDPVGRPGSLNSYFRAEPGRPLAQGVPRAAAHQRVPRAARAGARRAGRRVRLPS